MSDLASLTRCPRCEASVVIGDNGALSRCTRDDGAAVFVCNRCGQREALYGREPSDQIPLTDWPVDIDTLLLEEKTLIESVRGGEIGYLSADELKDGEA